MSEMIAFDLRSGYVTMTTLHPVTFERMARLPEAGMLAGIPTAASITDLRLAMQNIGPGGPEYRVDISWSVERR